MTAKRVAGRLAGILALLVVCAALFDVPSAYVIAAGKPRWLAWAVGVLAFPVLPVLWNVLAERRRAAPDPKKPAKTTRWERIWMRTAFVALVVIGGLFGMARGKAWRAVRHHALWFMPHTPGQLVPDSPLLMRVPSTATALVWLRDTETAQAVLGTIGGPFAGDDFELVIAVDEKHAYATERGDIHFVDTMTKLMGSAGVLDLVGWSGSGLVNLPDGSRQWQSPGWPAGSGPSAALIDPLRRAPDDAFLIGSMVEPKGRGSAYGWVAGRDGELELFGELEAKTEDEAKKLVEQADRELAKNKKEAGCWRDSGGEASMSRHGSTIRAHATIRVAEIRGLFLCLDLKK